MDNDYIYLKNEIQSHLRERKRAKKELLETLETLNLELENVQGAIDVLEMILEDIKYWEEKNGG